MIKLRWSFPTIKLNWRFWKKSNLTCTLYFLKVMICIVLPITNLKLCYLFHLYSTCPEGWQLGFPYAGWNRPTPPGIPGPQSSAAPSPPQTPTLFWRRNHETPRRKVTLNTSSILYIIWMLIFNLSCLTPSGVFLGQNYKKMFLIVLKQWSA